MRHKSSYSTHNEPASVVPSVSASSAGPLFTHTHANGADKETAGSMKSGSELIIPAIPASWKECCGRGVSCLPPSTEGYSESSGLKLIGLPSRKSN